jgi:lambda repressor-like predicted transcriptional regulator
MPPLLQFSDLERRRRLAMKTLRQISKETGLKIGTVWNVFHGRCPDIRKIGLVCGAIGVSVNRLNFGSFLPSALRGELGYKK